MADCPNDAELFAANERPHGNGGLGENARPPIDSVMDAINRDLRRFQEQQAKRETINRVVDTIRGDMLPPERVSTRDRIEAMRLSGRIAEEVNAAIRAQDNVVNSFDEAMRIYSGATVHDTSRFLNIISGLDRLFLNKDATMKKYMLLKFGQEGTSAQNHTGIQAFEAADARVRGLNQGYMQFIDQNIHAPLRPFADRIGMSVKDFAMAAGHLPNLRHTKTRNPELINRWRAELALQASRGELGDARRMQELRTWITELETHIDNPNPPEGLRSAGGRTNAQADAQWAALRDKLQLSEAEAVQIADSFVSWRQHIDDKRIEAGLIDPLVRASWPDLPDHVPLKTHLDNTTGPVNEATGYNPGRYYSFDGMSMEPDSAYFTLQSYGRRAANEEGMQSIGRELYAMVETARQRGENVGLMSLDYTKDVASLRRFNPQAYDRLVNSDNGGGGLIVDVPVRNAAGEVTGTARKFITFDQNWTDPVNGFNGADMNKALIGTSASTRGISKLANLTSKYGQLNTRLAPFFAPVNGMRDVQERMLNMAGLDYRLEDGSFIQGYRLLPQYAADVASASKIIIDWKAGRLDMNSPAGRLVQDYIDDGLHQEYTRGLNVERRSLADLVNETSESAQRDTVASIIDTPRMRGLRQSLSQFDDATRVRVMNVLDNVWNDSWNNIASLAHYKTLREAGVRRTDAQYGVLSMMDLGKKGSLVPALSTLFPFVKPTVQSVRAAGRTLGLAPNAQGNFEFNARGIAAMGAAYAAYMMVAPLARATLGRDEDGIYRYDKMGVSDLARFIPIGLDNEGNYAKLPLGFGASKIAATLAIVTDRINSGIMTPEDGLAETAFAIAREVTPADWPNFSFKADPIGWLQQAFTPTIVKPLVDVGFNKAFHGGALYNRPYDGTVAQSSSGRLSTPDVYHRFAEGVYRNTGIDLAPEAWKNFHDQYWTGPLRIFKAMSTHNSVRLPGHESTFAEDHGFFAAFGAGTMVGKNANLARNIVYTTKAQYDNRVRSEGIKLTANKYPGGDRVAYQRNVLSDAGWTEADIDEYMLLRDTVSQVQQLNRSFKQDHQMHGRWFSSENSDLMRQDFADLAEQHYDRFVETASQIRKYQGRRQ